MRPLSPIEIFYAHIGIVIYSCAAKALTFFRDILVAQHFGLSDDLDAFVSATVLPNAFISIFIGSVISALVSQYIPLRKEEQKRSYLLLCQVYTIVILVSILSSALMIMLSKQITSVFFSYNDNNKKDYVSLLSSLLGIFIVSGAVSKFIGDVLNIEGVFRLVAITPGLAPIITILAILISNEPSIFVLVAGLIFGSILEAIILLLYLKRHIGSLPRICWIDNNKHLLLVLYQYLPMVSAHFVMSGNIIVNQIFASKLPTGSVSALSFGDKLFSVIIIFGPSALSQILLREFSVLRSYHEFWREKLWHTFVFWSFIGFIVGLLLSTFVGYYRYILVSLLFEGGQFTSQNVVVVGDILFILCLQLPFYCPWMLACRLLSVLGFNYLITFLATGNFLLNIILNFFLVDIFGIIGINLASLFVIILASTAATILAFYKVKRCME